MMSKMIKMILFLSLLAGVFFVGDVVHATSVNSAVINANQISGDNLKNANGYFYSDTGYYFGSPVSGTYYFNFNNISYAKNKYDKLLIPGLFYIRYNPMIQSFEMAGSQCSENGGCWGYGGSITDDFFYTEQMPAIAILYDTGIWTNCEISSSHMGMFNYSCDIPSEASSIKQIRYRYNVYGNPNGLALVFGISNLVNFIQTTEKELIINQGNSSKEQIENANKNQQQTNERMDELNNSITSDSEDTSSSSCGLLCKLKGIFTGIIELPKKLISLLIDALKSLFVPTDEQLYEIINISKDLAENFGFVGEAISFFITIFTSLLGLVNANGCVELPKFEIGATSLFDGITFWEARNVCLNDNPILSANIDTIRVITSIALVTLFVNFAAREFWNVLSKNGSGSITTYDDDGSATTIDWSTVNGSTSRYRRRG